ncbi:hypothetical protein, partial [Pseudomonas aeruginosa]
GPAVRQGPPAESLAAATKRVATLLAKAEDDGPPNGDASLRVEAAEKALGSAVANAESEVAPLAAARDY